MEWSLDKDKVFQADIERMLALFEKIREVDTEGVEPMHTLPYEGLFRRWLRWRLRRTERMCLRGRSM